MEAGESPRLAAMQVARANNIANAPKLANLAHWSPFFPRKHGFLILLVPKWVFMTVCKSRSSLVRSSLFCFWNVYSPRTGVLGTANDESVFVILHILNEHCLQEPKNQESTSRQSKKLGEGAWTRARVSNPPFESIHLAIHRKS